MIGGATCPRCGARVDAKQIFCPQCGRLMARNRGGGASLSRWAIRVIELALLVACALLLWPVTPKGEIGSAEDAERFQAKVRHLETQIRRGVPAQEVFSEAEVNAYLAGILKKNPELTRSEGGRLGIGDVNLQFRRRDLVVAVIAVWGPMRFSYEVEGVPARLDGRFHVRVSGVRFGHLPLPGPTGRWVVERVAAVFSGLKREREVLDNALQFEMSQGKVRLTVGS